MSKTKSHDFVLLGNFAMVKTSSHIYARVEKESDSKVKPPPKMDILDCQRLIEHLIAQERKAEIDFANQQKMFPRSKLIPLGEFRGLHIASTHLLNPENWAVPKQDLEVTTNTSLNIRFLYPFKEPLIFEATNVTAFSRNAI